MFGKKCVYCGDKSVAAQNDKMICRSCGRENKPLCPISILAFEPINEDHLTLLKQRKVGFFEKKTHDEILSAACENRLLLAPAISDGFYEWQSRDLESCEENQFLRHTDGTPIEGRAYMFGNLVPEGKSLYVVLLITKKGNKLYQVISQEDYGTKGENLAQTLVNIEFSLLPLGGYDEAQRITI